MFPNGGKSFCCARVASLESGREYVDLLVLPPKIYQHFIGICSKKGSIPLGTRKAPKLWLHREAAGRISIPLRGCRSG